MMVVGMLTRPAGGQESSQMNDVREAINGLESAAPAGFQGLPTDWTHSHLVFSQPSPASPTRDSVLKEPRYWMQAIRRFAAAVGDPADTARPDAQVPVSNISRRASKKKHPLKRDWASTLGNGGTVGADIYPAKFSFNIASASCANDYVVFNTNLAGSATQATIVGYNNIYSGCGGTVPGIDWAYNTITGNAIATSVVLSGDGTQMAFVQTDGSGNSSLVLLRPKPSGGGTVSAPVTLTSTAAASYRTCTAPCMTSLSIANTDNLSAPFYDYTNDVIYVGDSAGLLHKYQNIFLSGTPGEAGGAWPVTVDGAGYVLTSPVFDSTSGKIFVGDSDGVLSSIVASTPATQVNSARTGHGSGIIDGPLVDSSAGMIYVFVSRDENSANGCSRNNPCSGVYQFPVSFANGSTGTADALVGTGTTAGNNPPLYDGTFDNKYLTSTSTSPTGNLYVCGNAGGNPILYKIAISANAAGTVTTGPTLTTAATACSPVTELCNPGTGTCANTPTGNAVDWIFLSVQSDANTSRASSCTSASSGCVMGFNVTSGSISTTTNASSDANEAGGTSGIIIDNTVGSGTLAGASQVYFSTLANSTGTCGTNVGCAVQASQSGL